jgi:hypothetical protein
MPLRRARSLLAPLAALALAACASSTTELPSRDEAVPRAGEGALLLSFQYRDPSVHAAPTALLATGQIEIQLVQVDNPGARPLEMDMLLAGLVGESGTRQIVLRGLPPGRYHFVRRGVRMFRGNIEYSVEAVEAEQSSIVIRPGVVTYAGAQVVSVFAEANVLGVVVPVAVRAGLEDRFGDDTNLLCQRVPRSCAASFLDAQTGHEGPLPAQPQPKVRQTV